MSSSIASRRSMCCHLPRCSLEELHLSLNNYTSVDLPEDFIYPSLTRLFFNKNRVEAWSQVSRLGRAFPGLQQLYLAETGLASLDEDGDRLAQQFPTLALLSLNKTQLGGWPEVERLRLLPALTDVRLQGIPFFEVGVGGGEAVMLITAPKGVCGGGGVSPQDKSTKKQN